MYCTKCGRPVRDGLSFCTQCGTKVKKKPDNSLPDMESVIEASVDRPFSDGISVNNPAPDKQNNKPSSIDVRIIIVIIIVAIAVICAVVFLVVLPNTQNQSVQASTDVSRSQSASDEQTATNSQKDSQYIRQIEQIDNSSLELLKNEVETKIKKHVKTSWPPDMRLNSIVLLGYYFVLPNDSSTDMKNVLGLIYKVEGNRVSGGQTEEIYQLYECSWKDVILNGDNKCEAKDETFSSSITAGAIGDIMSGIEERYKDDYTLDWAGEKLVENR